MAIPDALKFDIRVRERLLGDGVLLDSEVQKHLAALPDLDGQAVDLTIKQPALSNESDRDIVIVRTSGVRPPVAPVRPTDDDLPIPDDDDLDDDDDDDDDVKPEAKKAAEKAAEKVVEKVIEKVVEKPKAKDEDDDEDEDEEKKEETVDKEWGEEP
jgi:hypothetical protein